MSLPSSTKTELRKTLSTVEGLSSAVLKGDILRDLSMPYFGGFRAALDVQLLDLNTEAVTLGILRGLEHENFDAATIFLEIARPHAPFIDSARVLPSLGAELKQLTKEIDSSDAHTLDRYLLNMSNLLREMSFGNGANIPASMTANLETLALQWGVTRVQWHAASALVHLHEITREKYTRQVRSGDVLDMKVSRACRAVVGVGLNVGAPSELNSHIFPRWLEANGHHDLRARAALYVLGENPERYPGWLPRVKRYLKEGNHSLRILAMKYVIATCPEEIHSIAKGIQHWEQCLKVRAYEEVADAIREIPFVQRRLFEIACATDGPGSRFAAQVLARIGTELAAFYQELKAHEIPSGRTTKLAPTPHEIDLDSLYQASYIYYTYLNKK